MSLQIFTSRNSIVNHENDSQSKDLLIQFLLQVADIPLHLMTAQQLKTLVEKLDRSDSLLNLVKKNTLFKPDRVGLKNLLGNEFISILVVASLPQQRSIIHRHGQSLEVALVLQGTLTSQFFKMTEDQELKLDREVEVSAGDIVCTERYEYHSIINKSSSKVVSLHFHSPGLIE
ncbi:cupin domain-containing protein [Coleofasciculus sp. FACHB-1120]|uniref:cupin domain-containing protein n=1 Tax=Coleofasciculus sp. FACHB-1120 TaxID=2692783 RepID=UPI0016865EF8|nr:cupin domain-containing protein [Coleofasciculus sp. FACHB-1120]